MKVVELKTRKIALWTTMTTFVRFSPKLQVHGTQRPTLRCMIEAQIPDEDEDAVDGLQGGDEENGTV